MTVEEYIEKKKSSKVTLELIEKLKQFSHDPDYILGILAESKYDEDRQLIIDYIDHGEDVSYENVLLFSIVVAKRRDKQDGIVRTPPVLEMEDLLLQSRCLLPAADVSLSDLSKEDFFDHCEKIDEKTKEIVLEYLHGYTEPSAIIPGRFYDAVTGEECAQGYYSNNDGMYYWFSSDIYHFEKYDFKLSDEFVEHVLQRLADPDWGRGIEGWFYES